MDLIYFYSIRKSPHQLRYIKMLVAIIHNARKKPNIKGQGIRTIKYMMILVNIAFVYITYQTLLDALNVDASIHLVSIVSTIKHTMETSV